MVEGIGEIIYILNVKLLTQFVKFRFKTFSSTMRMTGLNNILCILNFQFQFTII